MADNSADILGTIPDNEADIGPEDVREFQILTIHLSDGRKVEATVPAFLNEGDEVGIERVTISEAMPLPEEMSFQKVMAPKQDKAIRDMIEDIMAAETLGGEDGHE